jgi:hypothetical protein
MGLVLRRRVAPALVAVVAVLVGLGPAAAGPVRTPSTVPAAAPDRVAVFGDSLAHEAKGATALALMGRRQCSPSPAGPGPT